MTVQTKVYFYADGLKIAADIYSLDFSIKQPAIILCNGFAGVKHNILPSYAKFFIQHGYVVICFDYRGFGESEGNRGVMLPHEQVNDVVAAVNYLAEQNFVQANNITLWGTSFGGANAIYAANKINQLTQNNIITKIIIQTSFASGKKVILDKMSDEEKYKFEELCNKAEQQELLYNKYLKMPAYKLLSDKDSYLFFKQLKNNIPDIDLKIQFSVLKHISQLDPGNEVKKLKIPSFVIGAINDNLCPIEESRDLYNNSVKTSDILEVSTNHYGVYDEPYFSKINMETLKWIKLHDNN